MEVKFNVVEIESTGIAAEGTTTPDHPPIIFKCHLTIFEKSPVSHFCKIEERRYASPGRLHLVSWGNIFDTDQGDDIPVD
jgi:hypothetical protein